MARASKKGAATGGGKQGGGATSRTPDRRKAPPVLPVLDLSKIRRYRLTQRKSLVPEAAVGRPPARGLTFRRFVEGLPDILAASELRAAVLAIAAARRANRGVVLGMGAHPIKVGLSPLIIDLMEQGVITAIAMNGACIVHDFELAFMGATSEDVGAGLRDGSFGMAEETGRFLNTAIRDAVPLGLGLGGGLGRVLSGTKLRHRRLSILAAGDRLGVPVTVHVAIGTDIIHMHPEADGAAIGAGSMQDFRRLAAVTATLDRGVFVNLGSAVIIPEVFVKALNVARNLGHKVGGLTTIDMDFIRQYRPGMNVLRRPTEGDGRAIQLTGHHEIMFPLLCAAVLEELGG
jgi:deoxyhypusine synthase